MLLHEVERTMQRLGMEAAEKTRQRNVLRQAATKLRLGYSEAIVRAELMEERVTEILVEEDHPHRR